MSFNLGGRTMLCHLSRRRREKTPLFVPILILMINFTGVLSNYGFYLKKTGILTERFTWIPQMHFYW